MWAILGLIVVALILAPVVGFMWELSSPSKALRQAWFDAGCPAKGDEGGVR